MVSAAYEKAMQTQEIPPKVRTLVHQDAAAHFTAECWCPGWSCGDFQCLDRLPCVDNGPPLDRPDKPPPPPPDSPGSPGQPSRAESRATAGESGTKPPDAASQATETDKSRDNPKPSQEIPAPREQGEKAGDTDKPLGDRTESPLERMPSRSGFANLAEEFDARRASREAAQGNGATNEPPSETTMPDLAAAKLDDDAIKEQIDPFAPDLSKTEGHKETFERTVRDSDAAWTEGVDQVEDLPTGQTLSEADEDKRSKLENFHREAFENVGTLKKGVEGVARTIDKVLGPKPTGQAEARTNGPVATDVQYSGIDAGSTASALLTLGIVGAEATRRVVGKFRERREADDDGRR